MSETTTDSIRLTAYSHGAGCGCKLSPAVLEQVLEGAKAFPDERLLVGNHARDDAAVYDLGDGRGVVSTTDFFMPIVDDPFTFGRIAAANAISDVYAMGGEPTMAIGILGWPIDKLSPEVARRVVEGGRDLCAEAGIPLAGGHSIDSPEPIFGLAVTGLVDLAHLKRNDTAEAGDVLFLTKGLGVGLLTTAEKKGLLRPGDESLAPEAMTRLNRIGAGLARLEGVTAMTDVTGFGLCGHLGEMCEGSGVRAEIEFARVPTLTDLAWYLEKRTIPGGTQRNWDSYGSLVGPLTDDQRHVLCDPQTSGGLLVAVRPGAAEAVAETLAAAGLPSEPIGRLAARDEDLPRISVA